jgi:hypothetical protein
VLGEHPDEASVNRLVRTAFQYAILRLKQLIHSGKLHIHSFDIPLDGIAFDCIADLFQRDSENRFVDLAEYFIGDRSLNLLDDAEATHHFRSLVFTKLNDGIFRLYRENDPVLSRIIRNVKAAIQKIPDVIILTRLGQTHISSVPECCRNDHLSEIDLDWLEQELRETHVDHLNTIVAMQELLTIVQRQEHYRRSMALIDAALLLKRLMVSVPENNVVESASDSSMFTSEIEQHLDESLEIARLELHRRYVRAGKLSDAEFHCYMVALDEMMQDIFLRNDGADKPHHEYLRTSIPDLTIEEYRTIHRTHFEYMVRVVKKIVKDRLKELV